MMIEPIIEFEYEKSSLGRRILAIMIDYLIFVSYVLTFLPLVLGSIHLEEKSTFILVAWLAFILLLTFIFLFFAKDSYKGMSLGKWMMGIMIRDENSEIEMMPFSN